MSSRSPNTGALAKDGHSVGPSATLTHSANGRQPVPVSNLIKIPSVSPTGGPYRGSALQSDNLRPATSDFATDFLHSQTQENSFRLPFEGSLATSHSESQSQVDTHFLERLQSSTPINGPGSSLAPISNPFVAPSPFPAVNNPAPTLPFAAQLDGVAIPPRPSPIPALPEKASGESRSRMPAQRKTIEKKRSHSEQKKKHAERARKAAATRKANKRRLEEERQASQPLPESLRTPTRSPTEVMPADRTPPADSTLRPKDRVLCRKKDGFEFDELAEIVKKVGDKLYVHPVDTDRRMDHWVHLSNVMRAPRKRVSRVEYDGVSRETRASKRKHQESNPVSEREEGNDAVALAEIAREEATAVKNVDKLVFGNYELDTWYFSPFDGSNKHIPCVYMCPHCLKYFKSLRKHFKHVEKCQWQEPPGAVIYADGDLKMYEVDGFANMAYCQRLAILGKLFLDHKTLFFDVAPFLFYVMTVGGELAGFFSKEKPERKSIYNLACILTLPQHQKKGLGRFLIEFSYELSRREGRQGQPERPLSDLGQVSYRSFWKCEVLKAAKAARDAGEESITSDRLAENTGISVERVVETLKDCHLYKTWKGETSADLTNGALIDKQLKALKAPPREFRSSCLRKPRVVAAKTPGTPRAMLSKGVASSKMKQLQRTPKRASNSNGNSAGIGSGLRLGASQARSPGIRKRRRGGSVVRATRVSPFGASRRRQQDLDDRDNQFTGAMQNFCEEHTPEKVMAPWDSEKGIDRSVYAAFAKNLGMRMEEVYSGARKKAQEMIMEKHISGMDDTAQTLVTGRPRGSGSGAKDVGHIERVMGGNRQSAKVSSPGGSVRGKMVSGFVGNAGNADLGGTDEEKREALPVPLTPNGVTGTTGSNDEVINLCSDGE